MNIKDKIDKLRRDGFKVYEIKNILLSEKYPIEEVNIAIKELEEVVVQEYKSNHPILTSSFTPVVLLASTLFLFFYLIPPNVASDNSILLALMGSVLTLVFVWWSLVKIFPTFSDKYFGAVVIISMVSLFCFGGVFIKKAVDFESNELKEHGVITKAVIVDLTQISNGRGRRISNMKVKFKTTDNYDGLSTIDISDAEFNSFNEGMEIPIIYSSKYSSIAIIAYPETMRQMGK
jgi:hypothetical protein